MPEEPPLVEVKNLQVSFGNKNEIAVPVVKGISFSIQKGQCLAVVGESGCGKSVSALSLARLLPEPPAVVRADVMRLKEHHILQLKPADLRRLRGKEVAYIFQDPGTSLNPVYTIRQQIREVLQLHRPEVKDQDAEMVRWLEKVGIIEARTRLGDYPWQFSGGMQQRVMIAMALCGQPSLLVADEPTTALDVTLQRQIMALLAELKCDLGLSILLITHNFGIIRDIADHVAVMWQGEIVEQGPVEKVLREAQHPYTRALIACVPRLGAGHKRLATVSELMKVEA